MGIFKKRIDQVYAARRPASLLQAPSPAPLSITSPWSPQDTLVTWAIDDALGALLDRDSLTLTRETALRVPGVKRAHGLICGQLAAIPFYQMNNELRTDEQPAWLTTSQSGVSPYHRMFGAASDWFFHGWACFGFNAEMTDAFHIPYGLWTTDDDGAIVCEDERVPAEYTAYMVAVPLGYGENGLLVDGADTIRQARNIEAIYQQRLDNPSPLTVLTVDGAVWDQWTGDEVDEFLEQWRKNRQKDATAAKPSYVEVETPGQVPVDLYETGRNGSRIDLANHVSLPASILDGTRQGGGGGGTEMRYQGVASGSTRSDLWEFGMPKRMLAAFESRMSLDDIVEPGLSIRGDLSHMQATPALDTNPTSED